MCTFKNPTPLAERTLKKLFPNIELEVKDQPDSTESVSYTNSFLAFLLYLGPIMLGALCTHSWQHPSTKEFTIQIEKTDKWWEKKNIPILQIGN